jgi:hypothetical protein
VPLVFILTTVGLFLGMAKPFHSDKPNEWDDVYLNASRHIAAGDDLYREVPLYTYPPFMAWLFLPLANLAVPLARLVWFAVCASSILVMVGVAWRLANAAGPRLFPGRTQAPPLGIWLVFLVGLSFGARPAFTALLHHQTDLLMDALIFLGIFALDRKRTGWGAVCFGLAGAMKCTPLLWCAYFLAAGPRRWMIVPALVAVAANLLPNLTHPPHSGSWWLLDWINAKVLCLMGTYPGHWNTDVMCNQSLAGSGYAWCVTTWTWTDAGFQILPREPLCSPLILKGIVYSVGLTLLSATLGLIWRQTRCDTPVSAVSRGLHCSMILLLMLLLSPMSHKTHFGLLLLPGFLLAHLAWHHRSRPLLGLLAVLLLGQLVTMHFWNVPFSHFAYWHGIQMFTTLALWGGCFGAALRWGKVAAKQPVPMISEQRRAA